MSLSLDDSVHVLRVNHTQHSAAEHARCCGLVHDFFFKLQLKIFINSEFIQFMELKNRETMYFIVYYYATAWTVI